MRVLFRTCGLGFGRVKPLWLWAIAAAAASALGSCSGSSSPVAPIATGPFGPSPSATLIQTTGTFPSPPPGTSMDDVAYVEAQLPESAPIPPTQVGTLGTVVTVAASSFTVKQIPLIAATSAAQIGAVDLHAAPPVGSIDAPLTVTTSNATHFEGVKSLSALTPGAFVIAGGSANAGTLSADVVAVIPSADYALAPTLAARRPAPEHEHEQDAVATTTSVNDALVGRIGGDGETEGLSNQYSLGCLVISTNLNFATGDVLGVNMPFTIGWNEQPPGYTALSGGGYNPPAPLSDWMTFAPAAGPTGSPTAYISTGNGEGASITMDATACKWPIPGKYTPANGSVGYQSMSQTFDPMPGLGSSITLSVTSCTNLGFPFSVTIGPASGGTGEKGGVGLNAGFSLCDPATVDGANLIADVDNVTGGTTNVTSVAFDPNLAPFGGVPNPGLISPTSATMSFTFDKWAYPGSWTDHAALMGNLLGLSVGPIVFASVPVPLAPVSASPATITIGAQSSAQIVVTPATATLSVGQSVQLTPTLQGYPGLFSAYAGCPPGYVLTISPMTNIRSGTSTTVTYTTKGSFSAGSPACNVYFNTTVNGGGGPGGTGSAKITLN